MLMRRDYSYSLVNVERIYHFSNKMPSLNKKSGLFTTDLRCHRALMYKDKLYIHKNINDVSQNLIREFSEYF